MIYCYSCLLLQLLWRSSPVSSETHLNQMFCSLTSVNWTASHASTHANRMSSQMHPHADDPPSLPSMLVSHQRHLQSNFQHQQQMNTHTQIERLRVRLEQARHANKHWPSVRSQDQVCLIERQIRQINNQVALVDKSDDNVYTIR